MVVKSEGRTLQSIQEYKDEEYDMNPQSSSLFYEKKKYYPFEIRFPMKDCSCIVIISHQRYFCKDTE